MNLQDDSSTHKRIISSGGLREVVIPPEAECASSEFGDSACGEPLSPHRVVLDFTPNSEDTDFVQKKCCAFWDFISTCPEIENWKVVPESNSPSRKTNISDIELSIIKTDNKEPDDVRTAVSVLELVEEKGLITRTFEARLPQSGCSIGPPDYFGDDADNTGHKRKQEPDKREVCTCVKPCVSKTCRAKSSNKVQDLCKDLENWDTEHPKSMAPPGHPPSLTKFDMDRTQ